MSPDLFRYLVLGWMAIGLGTFVLLFFISAPYGRFARSGWGPVLPARLGWVLMEMASPVLFGALFHTGVQRTPAAWAFLLLWEAHYLHRAFLYPLTLANPRPMPASVIGLGAMFNLVNAGTNGYFLFHLTQHPDGWLTDPRFLAGVALFVLGFVVNRWADAILKALRAPGETGYKIPRGGPYRLVSSPNYLGEIIEWTGWALLTWSVSGLAFAVWTAANLAPRARSTHRWYRSEFPDYPVERRALLPYLW